MSNPKDLHGPAYSKTSLNKVRGFLRNAIPSRHLSLPLPSQSTEEKDDLDSASQSSASHASVEGTDLQIDFMQKQIDDLQKKIVSLREENNRELRRIAGIIKRDTEQIGNLGERLDNFEEYVRMEKENIHTQMEELEAKMQHQITNQYSDLQEAIERLYLRMDAIQKIHQEQKEQSSIEELETSNARSLSVKLVNFLLTIAQVVLVLVNTVSETLRPLSTNIGCLCLVCAGIVAIALYKDDEVRLASERSLRRTFAVLKIFQ